MRQYRRICAEINLDHFEHNLAEIERLISPAAKICAVIKTDGYGHGAAALARVMERWESVWGYAVATIEEAEFLCRLKLKKPILILGYVFEEDISALLDMGVRSTVFSLPMAKKLSAVAEREGKTARVHIKLDTGMGRIGFSCDEAAIEEIVRISELPNIMVEGVFTHLARADDADKSFSRKQAGHFCDMLTRLQSRGIEIPIRHISNSAGIIGLPSYNFDLVRAGIILYGLWPSEEMKNESISLRPLMTLKSHIIHVKTLDEGSPISYGGTYRTQSKETIATVPVGYGDGYPRSLSNRGFVLIHGKRAPICGRVCMDLFMVNVTDIGDVKPGDEVILIGRDGDERITMEEIGDIAGRFQYEFACDIAKRVPRIYIWHGETLPPDEGEHLA